MSDPQLRHELDKLLRDLFLGLVYCILVKGFNTSYRNKETILFAIDRNYGNWN